MTSTSSIKPSRVAANGRPPTTSPLEHFGNIVLGVLEYLFSILKSTLLHLRQPLSYLLTIYLLIGISTLSYNLFTSSLSRALSPICRLPLTSYILPQICTYTSATDPSHPTLPSCPDVDPEFSALMSTHSTFSDILASTSTSYSLPLDMKRSETSIRDLRQIVRYSTLSTRNELVLEFDSFIESARAASYDLQKFNSHVGRTIDITLSTARWTQRVLDDMAFADSQAGYLPSLISKLTTPFQPVPFTESRLLDQYITHTRIISDEISTLIEEAQSLLLTLQNLEDRLDVIHSISLSSQLTSQANKDEILGHLWTILGGNRNQLNKYDKQLKLLRQVGSYRQIAWAHVSATLLKLQGMQAELEELRERVGSAEAESLVRKQKERTPLSVHLEAIRLGVERLEGERERGRELERGHMQRVTGGEGRMLEGLDEKGRREIGG